MHAPRWLMHSMAVALFFGTCAFAQDNTSAGQSGASNSQDATQSSKSSKSEKSSGATGVSAMDKKFVSDAAQGGLAEVDLGNLAKQNGSNDAVKQFGDRMVTDHSKANDELKSLAQQKGWTLPTEPKAADKSKKDRLGKMSGADFDKAYMRDMVADHEKDVKEFKKCAASCKDSDLKAWAAKTAPTLEDHLKMARDDAKQVGALSGGAKSEGKSKSKSGSSDSTSGKPSGAIQ